MKQEKLIGLLKEWIDLTDFQANEQTYLLKCGEYPDGRDIENPSVARRLRTIGKIFDKSKIDPHEEYLNSPLLVEYAEGEE